MKPPDVFGALVAYTKAATGFDVWLDREAEQTTPSTRALPYVVIDGDMSTEWMFETSTDTTYLDRGEVAFHCLATGGDAAATMAEAIKALFAREANWRSIPIANAAFVKVMRTGYGYHPYEEPDKNADVVYEYRVTFDVEITGAYP